MRLVLCCTLVMLTACVNDRTRPPALSDEEFWALTHRLSERAGEFTLSENLVSNEPGVAENARRLRRAAGVYIGVGPEQNFSYIARLRPSMAFIVDIRRENRNLHLLYKALFEVSADRLDFVSALFSRPRPVVGRSRLSAAEIFAHFGNVPPSPALFGRNTALVKARLITGRRLPLDGIDLDDIDRALKAFYEAGPEIRFWGTREVDAVQPTYQQLMTARDAGGARRSFLETEEAFQFVKSLHAANGIVPVIGDFGGPHALRQVGDYVRSRGDVVQAFYASNVAVYLSNRQGYAFCSSLAGLPLARHARFIDRAGVRSMAATVRACRDEFSGVAAAR